jgi:hypothetical protein
MASMRSAGIHRYRATLAELRMAGRPTTIRSLRNLAPITDRETQVAFERWEVRLRRVHPAVFDRRDREVDDYVLGLRRDLPSAVTATVADLRGDILVLRDLIAAGRRFDPYGGARVEPFVWDQPAFIPGCGLVAPIEMAKQFIDRNWDFRLAAIGLRCEALASADPMPSLRDLDAFVRAADHPVGLLDAFTTMAIAERRDRAYFEAACRGRLDAAALAKWSTDQLDDFALLADGWRGERICFTETLAEHLRAHPQDIDWWFTPRGRTQWERFRAESTRASTFVFGVGDCAELVSIVAAAEDRMRGASVDVGYLSESPSQERSPVRVAFPNLREGAQSAIYQDTNQRLFRLSARCLVAARKRHRLPLDQAELQSWLGDDQALAAAGNHLALRYERLLSDRFRLCVDPATPQPNFADATRISHWAMLGKRPRVVVPPKGGAPYIPDLVIDPFNVEVRLPEL